MFLYRKIKKKKKRVPQEKIIPCAYFDIINPQISSLFWKLIWAAEMQTIFTYDTIWELAVAKNSSWMDRYMLLQKKIKLFPLS